MKLGRLAALAALAALLVSVPVGARAFPDYVGSRALGMGGAGRADARGGEGPLLNPAGMSLMRLYTIDGGYQYINRGGGHLAHASVVDSTSGFNLAGALFYTYRSLDVPGGGTVTGHEPGVSLSFPFGDRVLLGFSGKYLHVAGEPAEADGRSNHSGFTADVGLIVRAGAMLTVGATVYNLHDLSTVHAPVALGYGIAFYPIPDFVILVDGLHDFTSARRPAPEPSGGTTTSVGGGAEFTLQRRVVFRAGGGSDGRTEHGYVTGGIAAISELGAVDAGFRQDVSGDLKATVVAVGLRLFIPQP
ncbi:MAG: hypothetical protein ABI560_11085 [Myxococcales bacterium]